MHWLNYKEFSNKNKNAVARDRNRERGAREATGSRTQKGNHRRNQRPKLTLKCACIVLRNLEKYGFQKNIKRRSKTSHAYKTKGIWMVMTFETEKRGDSDKQSHTNNHAAQTQKRTMIVMRLYTYSHTTFCASVTKQLRRPASCGRSSCLANGRGRPRGLHEHGTHAPRHEAASIHASMLRRARCDPRCPARR